MTTANSAPVTITLTTNNQTSGWQQDKTLQISNEGIAIYLEQDSQFRLRKIQMAARSIEKLGVAHAQLAGDDWDEASQWAFALGFSCVNKLESITFCGAAELVERLNNKLAVYAWSRDLTNQTPAELYPLKLAELTSNYIKNLAPAHVKTRLIQGKALQDEQWQGIYNVGKGSVNEPCLLELDFNPSNDENTPVAACLVGKGITFDSGGYSIKSSAGMFDMKCDMGGAAVVAGALALAIKQGLAQRVKLYLCCAENMISNDAYKLGDIITYKNGVTCEVANTDAEGRLVLADGLLAASETGAPLIIDAATLTGAAVLATGGDYSALFSLDPAAAAKAHNAAKASNEALWQLPLEPWHQDKCPSVFAETANSRTQKGGGAGGASNAAGFLSRFVNNEGAGWLHFDLAAAYNADATSLWAAGATGLGIATIADLISTP
ncbi:aminopeptidase B. Metallo peptidase. MEROPS family M17 [Colwellia chukchiensis]|uniref:Aminopeptidase B. Metallo peptidase. MEROPS family M17 n=1 Tax=Colwellia chukchiensis TaxID=641665 RepID=A0A1H7N9Z0_9GAMM|nr:aminopeptidase PepB [Colwellia chukchiensis]SEL20290.1 aminopeptidase B. Metallo peptidase. MEROPS family M17 [Colwellia chukchiensis]